jgi:hypothetical protein
MDEEESPRVDEKEKKKERGGLSFIFSMLVSLEDVDIVAATKEFGVAEFIFRNSSISILNDPVPALLDRDPPSSPLSAPSSPALSTAENLLPVASIVGRISSGSLVMTSEDNRRLLSCSLKSSMVSVLQLKDEHDRMFFDVAVTIAKLKVPFSLPRAKRIKNFFERWTIGTTATPTPPVNPLSPPPPQPSQQQQQQQQKKPFPPLYFHFELRTLKILTEDQLPFLFRYEARSVSFHTSPRSPDFMLSQFHLQFHRITFSSKPSVQSAKGGVFERTIQLPRLRFTLELHKVELRPQLQALAKLHIDSFKNTITSDLLNDILLFQVKKTFHLFFFFFLRSLEI